MQPSNVRKWKKRKRAPKEVKKWKEGNKRTGLTLLSGGKIPTLQTKGTGIA